VEVELHRIDMLTYSCAWTVTGSATKLKLVVVGRKQREQLRTLNVSQMTNSMRNSTHVSAVHAVFGLPLPALRFVVNSCTSLRLIWRKM